MASAQNDVFRVTARMTIGGDNEDDQNVMHFRQESAGALTDAQVLADIGQVLEDFYVNVVPDLSSLISFVDILVKNLTQDLLLGATPWPFFTVGGSAVDPSAYQTVGLLLMKTAKSRVVGRYSLGPFRENGLTNSNWVAGVQSSMLAMGAELLSVFNAVNGDWQYVVFNREFSTVTLPVSTGITIAARSQRRRARGIGS